MPAQLVTLEDAIGRIRDGDTLLCGGFGLVGAALTLLDGLATISTARDLTVVSNNIGEPGRGLGALLRQGRIKHGISSYFTSNPEAVAAVNNGEITAQLLPQGTFSEAIRAGGAGLGGFFTPVGAGTLLAEGKEQREIDGVLQVLEKPIKGDVALVYADRADALGNLWYRKTARNFNPMMATAATLTIAEVREIVPIGGIEGESIHTPAHLRRPAGAEQWPLTTRSAASRSARRASCSDGDFVNLGIGLPTLIPDFLGDDRSVFLHSENGIIGVGPRPAEGQLDPDLIDASQAAGDRAAGRRRSSTRPTRSR